MLYLYLHLYWNACACACSWMLQRSTAYGYVDSVAVFGIQVPTNVTQGFVAYGTTSYGYADFDNLLIDGCSTTTRNVGTPKGRPT